MAGIAYLGVGLAKQRTAPWVVDFIVKQMLAAFPTDSWLPLLLTDRRP